MSIWVNFEGQKLCEYDRRNVSFVTYDIYMHACLYHPWPRLLKYNPIFKEIQKLTRVSGLPTVRRTQIGLGFSPDKADKVFNLTLEYV